MKRQIDTDLRNGITIIEVLTAMVVAMIGVFGIMILIPFAIKQSEVGLDLDDAYRQAENGVAQFEILGYQGLYKDPADNIRKPLWVDSGGNQIAAPDVYAIDPLSVLGNAAYNQFPPQFSVNSYENDLANRHFPLVQELNLADFDAAGATPWAGNTGAASALRIFRATDDIVMADAADDFTGPLQIYDQWTNPLAAGMPVDVGRQSRGEMSWMAVVAPPYDADVPPAGAWAYRMFVLSFKNRVLTTAGGAPIPPGTARFPIGEVDAASRINTRKDIGYGGGNIQLRDVDDANGQFPMRDLRKDDWVMLINLNPDLPVGFQKQVGFFRVVAVFTTPATSMNPNVTTISLDGPDFVFNRFNSTTGNWVQMPTFAVHLANYDANALVNGQFDRLGQVVSVHERTFIWEQESSWNR